MPSFISSMLVALLNRLPLDQLAAALARLSVDSMGDLAYSVIIAKVPVQLQLRIRELIRKLDALDLPGEEKFRRVISDLKDPTSPLRGVVYALSQKALLIAVQGIYDSMKAK